MLHGYVVRHGDSPRSIAHRLAGNPERVGELFVVNRHKNVVSLGGVSTFATLTVGERLALPRAWRALGDAETDQEKVNLQTALALVKVFEGKPLSRSDAVAITSTAITAIAIAAGAAAPVTLFLGAAVVATEAITQAYIAAYNKIFPDKPKIVDTSCAPENVPRDESDPRWHFFGRNYGVNKGTTYVPKTFDAFAGPVLAHNFEMGLNCRVSVDTSALLLSLVATWNQNHGGEIKPGGSNAPWYIRTVYTGSGNPDFDGNYDNPVTAAISELHRAGGPDQIVLRSGPYKPLPSPGSPIIVPSKARAKLPITGGPVTGSSGGVGSAIPILLGLAAVGGAAYWYSTRHSTRRGKR